MDCAPSSVERDQRRRAYAAKYRAKNRERSRLAAVAYRGGARGTPGQPRKYPTPEAAAVAKRELDRLYKSSPKRVSEAWYREQFRVSLSDAVLREGLAAHEAWFDSLDDEPPSPL